MTIPDPQQALDLVEDITVAMLAYEDADGHLVSKPMATQEVDEDGDLWFIVERSSDKVRDLQARPRVNAAYAKRGAWVSVSGTAEVVDDAERLKRLWSSATDAWMTGGPDSPDNTLLRVRTETAEYWDSPGGAVVTLARLARRKVTGSGSVGENATVELD